MSSKILLIGESCENEYIYGRCEGISSEAPIPVMKFSKIETHPGMAGNVCLNLQALGFDITFLTNSEKIIKTRFVDDRTNNQILQVDNEEKVKPLLLPISSDNFDAIVIFDQDKGYITESKLFEIVQKSSCPIFIYSKKTSLPNKKNCFVIIDDQQYKRLDFYIDDVIIIQGIEGCIYENTMYPLEKINTYDNIGMENIFISVLTYGYIKHGNISRALLTANKALSISLSQLGDYVLTEKDLDFLG